MKEKEKKRTKRGRKGEEEEKRRRRRKVLKTMVLRLGTNTVLSQLSLSPLPNSALPQSFPAQVLTKIRPQSCLRHPRLPF
ncbi:hypothetical protein Pcinc_021571 [Petrolisthes cinctipes]|uniref:Uncharacterized protein n=1 Tax=Petrolisthes cinctipes TaxID=88211 RepID=A0AAE1FHB6_PETCI|nr:hypothetical protein Pcinc_021571 [Petrolisthes cinctipes]